MQIDTLAEHQILRPNSYPLFTKPTNLVGQPCMNCYTGTLTKPLDEHISYVWCANCGAIELTYEPQPYQESLHSIPYIPFINPTPTPTPEQDTDIQYRIQIVGVFGGYGSGKSRSSLTEILMRALESPNGTGLLTAPTLQQLKRTTLETFFKEVCPPPLIEDYNKTEGCITLVNGFKFYTIPSDDELKLRSINAGLIHMEEGSGIKRSIYDQLKTRMRDPFVKHRLFIVCSNPDLGWIKTEFVDNDAKASKEHPKHEEYDPYRYCFIWKTYENKYLPPDFIELNSKNKPDWWIARFLNGSFEHAEGLVYANFSKTLVNSWEYLTPYTANLVANQIDEYGIPKFWERFANLDHGLRNPTAFYMNAINPNTWEVITYAEYYQPERVVPDHAKEIKPMLATIAPGMLWFMVADPSIRNRTDPINGKSVLSIYAEYELFFTPGNNDLDAGLVKVNSYINRGKWKVFKDRCPSLVNEGLDYKYPELTMDDMEENLDEKPIKRNDHAMDSMRYGFMRLPDEPEMLRLASFSAQGYKYTKKDNVDIYNWAKAVNAEESSDETATNSWLSYGF